MELNKLGLLVWTFEIGMCLIPVNSRMSSSKNWGDPGAVFGLRTPDPSGAAAGSNDFGF